MVGSRRTGGLLVLSSLSITGLAWGCGSGTSGHGNGTDASMVDVATTDANQAETGLVDAAPIDAGTDTGSETDGGSSDADGDAIVPLTCIPSGPFDATNPASAGYALAFSDEFTNLATIDLGATGKPGYNWYVARFDEGPTLSAKIALTDGGVMIAPTKATANYNMGTAGPSSSNADGYVGQVFGGGGYFEARLKFDPTTVDAAAGFPAFWGESVEHFAQKGADYPPGTDGGFEHFAEDDFFEFDLSSSTIYSTALIDWYGAYDASCESGLRKGQLHYCQIVNDGVGTPYDNYKSSSSDGGVIDWTQWHTIGQLWVTGNAADGSHGYVQNFIDGVPAMAQHPGTGTFTPLSKTGWDDSASYTFATLPDSGAVFSILDDTHLVVILGSGPETPITVSYVKIWQIPGCAH